MARKANRGTTTEALRRMGEADPKLAAQVILHSLPAAAADLPSGLSYRLEISELGAYRVAANGGPAKVSEVPEGSGGDLNGDAFAISTDASTLARIAGGRSPIGPLLRGKLKVRGKRRKALALRKLSQDAGPRELAQLGAPVDPDLLYRALAYAIDPEWTRGHNFRLGYEIVAPPNEEGGGRWHLDVRDGAIAAGPGYGDPGEEGEPDGIARVSTDTFRKLLSGELTPSQAMQLNLTEIDGDIYAVTLAGRWMDRAEGRDGAELEREVRQRQIQSSRAGAWGSKASTSANGGASSDAGDPGARRPKGGLMDYEQLYALWERQNWRSHELDFSVDREHWLATPAEAQAHTAFSLGSFYVGEERVTADLAPFVMAAPSGEVEAFLSTQLVDEMRHAVFFDRWMAQVMGLEAGDMRARLQELESKMLGEPWHFLFDDSLRDIANRIKDKPDDLELFVEGIVTYHMVTEGVLAMPGQRIIIQYTEDHSLFPGFNKGFRLVEQDEHRHIAFGVRFLKDVCEERPEMKAVILRRLEQLLPKAAEVFMPPEADDPADFTSYGHHSSQVYGFAYQALQRRMKMIGIEIPPPERMMPGPVDYSGLDERRPLREQAAATTA
jgi:ribonucleoside-diphosphate reductase beta chain